MIGANATFIREARLEEELGNSLVVKEPVGVVGCITPWNYPLHQVVCKIAPALAAGCTVVLKPAELAPLSAFILAEAAREIGLPAGVINVVSGRAASWARRSPSHPGHRHGQLHRVAGGRAAASPSVAGAGIKKVCLELGGKSAFVVLDDAPFEKAMPAGVNHCMQNSGQTCSAWTRMLVPRARQAEAVDLAVAQLAQAHARRSVRRGTTRLGPLVSAAQRESVLGYIAKGRAEGARLVAGGGRPASLPTGFYVEPTIFADVDNAMTIAQEEIFGPVLAIIPYDTEADAVRIANDSPYGLSGGVWAGTRRAGAWPSRAGCAPARWTSTAAASTRWRRSAATRSRASAARSARSPSTSSSRSRRFSGRPAACVRRSSPDSPPGSSTS